MKVHEIGAGLAMSLNNEEHELAEKIKSSQPFAKSDLSEREQHVARMMVSRGILKRIVEDKKVYFRYNKKDDVWRI